MLRSKRDLYSEAGMLFPVADDESLDKALRSERTTVLFLDDPFCPVSARARGEMRRAAIPAHVIDVARRSNLSRRVEERTGVRLESPQVIVLAGGRPVWSASHFGISADAVARAVTIADELPATQD